MVDDETERAFRQLLMLMTQSADRFRIGMDFGPCLYLMRLALEDLEIANSRLLRDGKLTKSAQAETFDVGKNGEISWPEPE